MRFLITLLFFIFGTTAFAQKNTQKDSIKAIVDFVLPGCPKGQFRSVCTTGYFGNRQDLYYRSGNIAFLGTNNSDVIFMISDTITLCWRDPKYKGGRYFLEFKDMFDDIIEYKISNTNSYFFDFKTIPPSIGKIILLTIYSEDRRASSVIQIRETK